MDNIRIEKDSRAVQVLTAQARHERVESDQSDAQKTQIADLAGDPTPNNRHKIGQLISFTINKLTQPTVDWIGQFADVKQVGWGDKAVFNVKMPGIRAFIQSIGATTARSYVTGKQVTLDTFAVSTRPAMHFMDLKMGRINMADLINDANNEMNKLILQHVQKVLMDAVVTWQSPFYAQGMGIVKNSLNPMIQHWMRYGGVTLLGDIYIVSLLAEQTGFSASAASQQFSPNAIDSVMNTGYIGMYYGASVNKMTVPYLEDELTPAFDTKKLFILPTALSTDLRPLKVIFEGDVNSMESQSIDDMVYEIRLDRVFGAGIVMGDTPTLSVYESTT